MSQASTTQASPDAIAKRRAAIDKLCATLGTQYKRLRQYRSL